LVSLLPAWSHVHSAMPLALELTARGHEVTIATSASFGPSIEAWGVRAAAVGPAWDISQVESVFPGFLRAHGGGQVRTLARLGGETAAELFDLAASWRPDVVVRDSYDTGGLLTAVRFGLPQAVLGIGIRPPLDWLEATFARPLTAMSKAHGVDIPDLRGALIGDVWLSPHPPAFDWAPGELPAERHVQPSGFAGTPDDIDLLPADVYVTFGTLHNKEQSLLRTLISALDDSGLRVIATTGSDVDPADLGPFSERVQVAGYVPQSAVLPLVRAVVSHGGFNTVLPALAAGRPVCCVPLSMDNPVTAARCAAAGVGTVIGDATTSGGFPLAEASRVDASSVLRSVLPLLDDPSYAARAKELAAEIERLPGAGETADMLEQLVR
jgi:UDP:flavonoid glycosyltransferase YjiC (YdhE family)